MTEAITRINQFLEDDSKLVFKFPNPSIGAPPITRTCPFFENPIIKEDQSSNLVKYNVIGRSSNIFGYTGAKSRGFNLTFNLTLPHLFEFSRGLRDGSPTPSNISKEEQKKAFFIEQDGADYAAEAKEKTYATWLDRYKKKLILGSPLYPTAAANAEAKFLTGLYGTDMGTRKDKQYSGVVELMAYWVELIRSSMLTYSPNPSLGPPIIRFSHGILYRDIATVASRYSITVDERYGIDNATLLPHRLEINLTLHEVLSNGDRSFELGKAATSDKIYGWERLIGRTSDEKMGV